MGKKLACYSVLCRAPLYCKLYEPGLAARRASWKTLKFIPKSTNLPSAQKKSSQYTKWLLFAFPLTEFRKYGHFQNLRPKKQGSTSSREQDLKKRIKS
jgi:hypothetical protein